MIAWLRRCFERAGWFSASAFNESLAATLVRALQAIRQLEHEKQRTAADAAAMIVGVERERDELRAQLAKAQSPGNAEHVNRIIERCEERKEFVALECGYVYYWPDESPHGAIGAEDLRVIADELDKRNAAWDAQVQADPAISDNGIKPT